VGVFSELQSGMDGFQIHSVYVSSCFLCLYFQQFTEQTRRHGQTTNK